MSQYVECTSLEPDQGEIGRNPRSHFVGVRSIVEQEQRLIHHISGNFMQSVLGSNDNNSRKLELTVP